MEEEVALGCYYGVKKISEMCPSVYVLCVINSVCTFGRACCKIQKISLILEGEFLFPFCLIHSALCNSCLSLIPFYVILINSHAESRTVRRTKGYLIIQLE